VALTVIDVIESQHLVEHAAEMGDLLGEAIEDLGQKDARGVGLMRAFSFEEPVAKAFQQKALESGLLINATDDNTVRMVPPLIIQPEHVEEAHGLLKKALAGG
jgi:acetylornithine/N-succinyldiaminopimelate aminotransferase